MTQSSATSPQPTSAADIEYWKQRWSSGKTGWHQSQPTQTLAELGDLIPSPSSQTRFLLPLCGATLDILYLYQRGYHVIGVESAEVSIQQFFADNAQQLDNNKPEVTQIVQPTNGNDTGITKYSYRSSDHSGAIDLYVSDWFHPQLNAPLIGGRCQVVFDRCGLVALPYELHQKYVTRLMQLIDPLPESNNPHSQPSYNLLFQSVEYPVEAYKAPPHHLPRAEVESLFSSYLQSVDNNKLTELHRVNRGDAMRQRVENLKPNGAQLMKFFNFIIYGVRIINAEQ